MWTRPNWIHSKAIGSAIARDVLVSVGCFPVWRARIRKVARGPRRRFQHFGHCPRLCHYPEVHLHSLEECLREEGCNRRGLHFRCPQRVNRVTFVYGKPLTDARQTGYWILGPLNSIRHRFAAVVRP